MGRVRGVLVAGVLAVVVSAVAVGPAAAAKGGNSENAHAYQQGGHENLFEAPTGVEFKNAGDCANSGAKGVALGFLAIVDVDPVGTFYQCPNDPSIFCFGGVSWAGLDPNTFVAVQITNSNNTGVIRNLPSGSGTGSLDLNLSCFTNPRPIDVRASGQAQGQVVQAADVKTPCQ